MTETIFIDAVEGAKVAVFKGAGNQIGAATTPKMLAYILDTHKIFGEVMFCSTMDFATELVLLMMVMRENCLMMQLQ